MCCKNFWKKSIPFFLAFCLGILFTNLFSFSDSELPLKLLENKVAPPIENKRIAISCFQRAPDGRGRSVHSDGKGNSSDESVSKEDSENKAVEFISKPKPQYTEEAKRNSVQGTVHLRITFLANGEIGSIMPVKELLPDGLTEQAMEAARKIKFKPALRNGKPHSVNMSVQYTFTIY